MKKTKLSLTMASALMAGSMVAVLGASAQAAPILAGPQSIGTMDTTTLSGSTPAPFPDSSLCFFDAFGDAGGCARQRLTGTIDFSYTNPNALTLGPNTLNGTAWTVHDVHFLAPGTYTNLLGVASYDMTVGANQLGATMQFDWGLSTNMRIISLWEIDDVSTPGVRKLRPVDADGDGIIGAAMVDTLTGCSPVLNMTIVPLPAAAWLFGSGLLGLVGVARRRNKASA